MNLRQALNVTVLGIAATGILAGGALADWLVLQDGTAIETDGPFEIEDDLAVFVLPNGTLGSLPVSEVDREATRKLAEKQAAAAETVTEPAAPQATFVITDADVGHPNLNRPAAPAGEVEGETGAIMNPALEVTAWREDVDLQRNSVEINGTLENPTENPATTIEMDVMLFDEDGGLLERSPARLEHGFLNPGTSMRFEARFTDTLAYDSIDFDIRSRGFLAQPPEDEPGADEDESGFDDDQDGQ